MAGRSTVTISLTPHLEDFVASRVSSGRYLSASEVVREGLRLLEERELRREAELAELRAKIRVGLEEAKAGELLDGDEVFRELEVLGASKPGAGQ
jgi:antitoxin ParD1/3/4